jgi:hypothetical protein
MKIVLTGVSNPNDHDIQGKAFAKLTGNAPRCVYWRDTPGMVYHAYLVDVLGLTDTQITFRGVNRNDGSVPTDVEHVVDLRNTNHVWAAAPSCSLANWDVNAGITWAILFLSDNFIAAEKQRLGANGTADLTLALEDPGNKWPRGASDALKALVDAELSRRVHSYAAQLPDEQKRMLLAIFQDLLV